MNNSLNISEDADMAVYEGDKIVTMIDVLQEQEEFEEDANAVLGASDAKNCTYSKGYVKRQAVYACLTCCVEAKIDPSKRAGICLACSLNCHENHELIELYTRRNFRCDCGNPKFNPHPCQFVQNKTDLNEDNKYNQNFIGLYCVCHRPYPDPEAEAEEEMIQCTICEDWLHASHLEAILPANDQYAEMICKSCMETNEFLYDYSDLMVNVDAEEIDVTITDIRATETDEDKKNNKLPNGIVELTSTQQEAEKSKNNSLDLANSDIIESPQKQHTLDSDNFEKESVILTNGMDVESNSNTENEHENSIEKQIVCNSKDSTLEAIITHKETNDEILDERALDNGTVPVSDEHNVLVKTDEERNICEQINDDITKKETLESVLEPSVLNASIEDKVLNEQDQCLLEVNKTGDSEAYNVGDIDDIKNSNFESTKDQINLNNTNDIAAMPIETKNICSETNEATIETKLNNMDSIDTDSKPDDQPSEDIHENILKEKFTENSEELDTLENATKELLELTSDMVEEDVLEAKEKINESKIDEISETNVPSNSGEIEKPEGSMNDVETQDLDISKEGFETEDNTETDSGEREENLLDCKDTTISEQDLNKVEESDETHTSIQQSKCGDAHIEMDDVENKDFDETMETEKETLNTSKITQNEHKRKFYETNDETEVKKLRLEENICKRPRGVKRIHKGATFWASDFRQKLCACNECLTMYKDLRLLFLLDPEDTVTAYETLGKQNIDGEPSQYEKGLQALSSLDRIQQINAVTEFNNMRDKLLDFLKSFKDRNEIVKEEDIKSFFAGMKPRREPDGVYFCR